MPGREDVFDVPVWRPSPEGDPAWPSPWGWGRPGWHSECAAMSLANLGHSVDVLFGGTDLTFPHHVYQAAMVEAATGVTPYARAVAHVGEVRHDGMKMAKSTGNLVLVSDLVERYPGEVLRLGLLNRPWREAWDCTDGNFDASADLLERLRAAAEGAPETKELHAGVVGRTLRRARRPGRRRDRAGRGAEPPRRHCSSCSSCRSRTDRRPVPTLVQSLRRSPRRATPTST